MKSIKIIETALKNKHNFNTFCMQIQSKDKTLNAIERDKFRATVNPKIRKENNYQCSLCGKNVLEHSNTIHHINPERYSGSYEKDNLLVVCMNCHNIIENCIRVVERQAIKHTLIYLLKKQTNSNQDTLNKIKKALK